MQGDNEPPCQVSWLDVIFTTCRYANLVPAVVVCLSVRLSVCYAPYGLRGSNASRFMCWFRRSINCLCM